MKNIKIVTRHIPVDLASSSRTRQENIMHVCRTLIHRGSNHYAFERLNAEVFIREDDVLVAVRGVQYICDTTSETGIYVVGDHEVKLQRLDDSEQFYDQIRAIEEVVLLASISDPSDHTPKVKDRLDLIAVVNYCPETTCP